MRKFAKLSYVVFLLLFFHITPGFAFDISPSDIINNWSGWRNASILGDRVMLHARAGRISDFTLSENWSFSGVFAAYPSDNDEFGIYFGWQDNNNHYRFGWDAGGMGEDIGTNGTPNSGGSLVHGMRLIKMVNGIKYFLYQDLPDPVYWQGWYPTYNYSFNMSRVGDTIFLKIDRIKPTPVENILDISVVDASFINGHVGIYNYGQTSLFGDISILQLEKELSIDIKPGSDPNCFNINDHGVIPVAILGGADFDVTIIDTDTLIFAGLEVRVRGNKGPLCHMEDVSGDFTNPEGAPDGYLDLVCQFEDNASMWSPGNSEAELEGELFDGTPIKGSDSICVKPE